MKLKDMKELNRIRGFREELGLTQRALAEKIGTSQQQIQRIETGVQSVRHDLALKISAVLGASVGALFPAISEAVQRIAPIEGSPAHVSALAVRRRSAVLTDIREIHNWAARLDAPAIFPQLIKRLALYGLPGIEEIQVRTKAEKHGSVSPAVTAKAPM